MQNKGNKKPPFKLVDLPTICNFCQFKPLCAISMEARDLSWLPNCEVLNEIQDTLTLKRSKSFFNNPDYDMLADVKTKCSGIDPADCN